MKSPIFLFSLPRSGSTLLQRVLMSHNEIASVAEPWIMLPFTYAYKKEGVLTEYFHDVAYAAIEDFINNLPNKETDYYQALKAFATTLYEKQCLNNETYFLDKTPRYYNIIPEIAKIFPDAKFIFLFRNPIHVMSSMMHTWCDNRFKKMYLCDRDLNFGPDALSHGYELLRDKSYAIRYEDYVSDPEKYTQELCAYLGLNYEADMLKSFILQNTRGRAGDPTGVKEYKSVDTKSLHKWKETFNTKFRQKTVKKYIENIDTQILKIQGYDKNQMLEEINNLEAYDNKQFQDRIDKIYSELFRVIKPNIWFAKTKKNWAKNNYLS